MRGLAWKPMVQQVGLPWRGLERRRSPTVTDAQSQDGTWGANQLAPFSAARPAAGRGWADLRSRSIDTSHGSAADAALVFCGPSGHPSPGRRHTCWMACVSSEERPAAAEQLSRRVGCDALFPWTPTVYGPGAAVRRGFFQVFWKVGLDQWLAMRSLCRQRDTGPRGVARGPPGAAVVGGQDRAARNPCGGAAHRADQVP